MVTHWRRVLTLALPLVALTACTVPDDLLEDRPCPCIEGWVCVADVCVRESEVPDGGAMIDAFAEPDATTEDGGLGPDLGTPEDAFVDPDGGPPGPVLLAHWECDDLIGLASQRVEDATGNGRDAECSFSECPDIVEGAIGQACAFDGTDELRVSADPVFDPTDGFTVAGWVKVRHVDGSGSLVAMPYGTDRWNSWQLFVYNSEGGLNFVNTDGTAADALTAPAAVSDDAWHHFAATWDGTDKRLYVDGILAAEEPSPGAAFVVQPILLGRDENETEGPVFGLTGALDDVRVYDGPLDAAALLELATLP